MSMARNVVCPYEDQKTLSERWAAAGRPEEHDCRADEDHDIYHWGY